MLNHIQYDYAYGRSFGFLPSDLQGLGLWLDAADAETITESSGFVSQWNDKSGNGRDAVQLTGSEQPQTGISTIGILNALKFDGINDFLDYDGTFLAGTDYTVFVVEQRTDSSGINYWLGGQTLFANRNLHLGYRNTSALTHAQFSNDYNIAVPAFTVLIPRVHAFTHNSVSGKKYYQNGSQQGSSANTTPLIDYLGTAISKFATFFYTGDIGEIIIYDRTLLDSERMAVENYLIKRWIVVMPFPIAFSDDFTEDYS